MRAVGDGYNFAHYGAPQDAVGIGGVDALRAELRSVHESNAESQRERTQLVSENQGLRTRLADLENVMRDMSQEVSKVTTLEADLRAAQDSIHKLRKENQHLKESVGFTEDELRDQAKRREEAEIYSAQAEAEKKRLQASREELMAQLRLANERLRDAEEEQCRAEAEAAAAKRELRNFTSSPSDAAALGDIGSLRQELEVERSRTDGLAAALEKTRAENQSLSLELKEAKSQIRDPESSVNVSAGPSSSRGEKNDAPPVQLSTSAVEPKASSASTPVDSQNAEEMERLQNEMGKMRHKVAILKNSRDKLLFEVDRQSVEVEALQAEALVLKEELADAKKLSTYWKTHATASVGRIEKLKDMLEESAKWSIETETGKDAVEKDKTMERELLHERAHAAELDKEVRKLTMDLVNSTHQNQQLKRSWLPVLHGVEASLMQLASSAADVAE